MGRVALETKRREILQLLRDWRSFFTPFGGAAVQDGVENLEAKGSYGPAGLIFAGTEFERTDRRLLLQSFADLWGALVRMQREKEVGKHPNGDPISGSGAYNALREPYLDDPADASMVDDFRSKLAELDRENAGRAKKNPPEPPRVALVSPRRFLERHDAAIQWLAEDLANVELHVVYPKLMSPEESEKIEHQYAEMYAVFQRIRVSGVPVRRAMAEAAGYFGVEVEVIERVVEFRSEDKPDTCVWGGCGRAPFRGDLCVSHYNKKRRLEKKSRP